MASCAVVLLLVVSGCTSTSAPGPSSTLTLSENDTIVLVGGNMASRMMAFGHFEAELYARFPALNLVVRNMADPGDTPGFRPHSSRNDPWAFPGAEQFQTDLATDSGSEGHRESPDEWMTRLGADIVLGFFGGPESFSGPEGLAQYKSELAAFIQHTQAQQYNGASAPQLALVSPIAFEDLSARRDLPNGFAENSNLQLYTEAMREVAAEYDVPFVNAFVPTNRWYDTTDEALTTDGLQLTDAGYDRLADFLVNNLFGEGDYADGTDYDAIQTAVLEKNWFWHNDFKIPNGVHVNGRRYNPFGPDNYPYELEKIRQMTANRDTAIWRAAQGQSFDLAAADARTRPLPPVESNYRDVNGANVSARYLYGDDALATFTVPDGYQIELFASEEDFPELANPVQLSFDNAGRLWVSTLPSYPHYKPGDEKPNDKIIILEDTDGDGRADKSTTWADGLHLPIGFEFAPEGVYVSQAPDLVLLQDTDGDDRADTKEIILSGFDDHDTHHAISAFAADPSGAFHMAEGVFLHTNVETPWGPVRATNGGFYRYSPQRRYLERVAQVNIPNPWGIAFDEWGQDFFAETSGPPVRWMMPSSVKPRYGVSTKKTENLIDAEDQVRPTSGLEFVSSRHFPDEVQGDLMYNNTIGFLGTRQFGVDERGTGYDLTYRQDLVESTDGNFRPVDLEFAPDGSLYIVDWHNILIGHMQHNARDPFRDHVHGRIYRITYPSRPLVRPAFIADAPIDTLLANLTLPEYRTRYRTRRELRGRDAVEVQSAINTWIQSLDESAPRYEHHLLEALWVTWGLNKVDQNLLRRLLNADDHRVRAAAVRVLRYTGHQVDDQANLLMAAAQDGHGRVRLEAITAASWLPEAVGTPIVEAADDMPLDEWMADAHATALAHLRGKSLVEQQNEVISTNLTGADRDLFVAGKEIYQREGFCATCHQMNGEGLSASQFPPLAGTRWVTGSEDRLIKITLHGLIGPIEVSGKTYPGQVPMTPFGGMLSDEEVAAVLTYVRNSFGNEAAPVSPETVARIRTETEGRSGFYTADELLRDHPLE
ncbi:MAG: GDSL-type esterase/lipase family protein [Rhodothermales bacterium]